ncbi:MoaD/ThiS family protein [Shimia litoralis]|uniref:MoaD/ThiS family protein n=1 Tax=Shimia litoralis TaxID=420403 RepID=A0A4U7MWA9_9RHOB|nr:MoaD/ThiS family protein [Shimia litoralis]TKZ17137.1 MoaD/ThiS family protein [Shimia litoralis]
MVEVHLWSGLRRFVEGRDTIHVQAKTVGEVFDAIKADYPALRPVLDAGVSISVDGQIIVAGRHEPIRDDSEVFLLQKLKGG